VAPSVTAADVAVSVTVAVQVVPEPAANEVGMQDTDVKVGSVVAVSVLGVVDPELAAYVESPGNDALIVGVEPAVSVYVTGHVPVVVESVHVSPDVNVPPVDVSEVLNVIVAPSVTAADVAVSVTVAVQVVPEPAANEVGMQDTDVKVVVGLTVSVTAGLLLVK
jgi:hypothetical protein